MTGARRDGTGRSASPRSSPPPRLRWPRLAAALATAALLLGGCAAPHSNLGTPSSRCFKALPAAERAVHGRGHLLGIRLSSAARVVHLSHLLAGSGGGAVTPSDLPGGTSQATRPLCVAAFKGQFGPGQVTGTASMGPGGHYAIVVVAPNGDGAVHSFVVAELPVRFRHLV